LTGDGTEELNVSLRRWWRTECRRRTLKLKL